MTTFFQISLRLTRASAGDFSPDRSPEVQAIYDRGPTMIMVHLIDIQFTGMTLCFFPFVYDHVG